MKKAYVKPDIVFESFALSVNIATCEMITPLPVQDTCGFPTRAGIVFLDSTTGCSYTPADKMYDGHCYHVPYEDKNLFSS